MTRIQLPVQDMFYRGSWNFIPGPTHDGVDTANAGSYFSIGDVVTGSDGGMYVCTGNNKNGAVWVLLSNNGVVASKTITDADYKLVGNDAGRLIKMNSTSPHNLILPAAGLSVDVRVDIIQINTGQVTVVGEDGSVSIGSFGNLVKMAGRYAGITAIYNGSGNYYLTGNLSS